MAKQYKGWLCEKGYPGANAMICWIGDKSGKYLYAKTLKELKEKIDNIEQVNNTFISCLMSI